jgi:hypothetical protein
MLREPLLLCRGPHPSREATLDHHSHDASSSISNNMLTIPPRARQAPEVRQVLQLYLRTLQHSSFGSSPCKRTPCVRVAVVCIELQALATIEDIGELGPQLMGRLEERRRYSGICEDGKGVREMAFVYPYAQFGR